MQCPRCGTVLQERTRAGVAVDACGHCRGMWLDRGELERIAIRLRELEIDRDADGGGARLPIPWGNRFRYPRRHPKRRLGPITYYR